MKLILTATLAFGALMGAAAAQPVSVRIHDSEADNPIIPKEIYGQFAEHLGTCIYGGLWVGPDSEIPNDNGYRVDVLEALRELKVPVMRWPGGCFADEYHWTDGIGPRGERPRMVNSNWGGTVEDNSFGTHEFLDLCEKLGCEPYISGNVGSGTPEELAKWVEYMTAEEGPMAELRKKNGREKPWKVKYLGVGNESWGCGGNMRPEYYSDLYRRYSTYCRNFNGNRLYKIASGASDYDYTWTETLMKQVGGRMDGLSLHYYTVADWDKKGSATQFSDSVYYATLGKALEIEQVLRRHEAIMDSYDPERRVDLLVDEWGTWFDEEPGTVRGHLYQQNTLRDAMVAALTLNVFHRHTNRVKMANIAQIVNVLQSMILTRGDEMVLTPTYYLFGMYGVHQDAEFLPAACNAGSRSLAGKRSVPDVDVTASRDASGTVHVSLVNPDLKTARKVTLDFDALKPSKVSGEILTAAGIADYNDFGGREKVRTESFGGFRIQKGAVEIELPAKSVVTLAIR